MSISPPLIAVSCTNLHVHESTITPHHLMNKAQRRRLPAQRSRFCLQHAPVWPEIAMPQFAQPKAQQQRP